CYIQFSIGEYMLIKYGINYLNGPWIGVETRSIKCIFGYQVGGPLLFSGKVGPLNPGLGTGNSQRYQGETGKVTGKREQLSCCAGMIPTKATPVTLKVRLHTDEMETCAMKINTSATNSLIDCRNTRTIHEKAGTDSGKIRCECGKAGVVTTKTGTATIKAEADCGKAGVVTTKAGTGSDKAGIDCGKAGTATAKAETDTDKADIDCGKVWGNCGKAGTATAKAGTGGDKADIDCGKAGTVTTKANTGCKKVKPATIKIILAAAIFSIFRKNNFYNSAVLKLKSIN
ncbi:MAG: hypothetical protein QG657_1114, partial [Acidobacteriota bacterium]|nr:hypothetical protein [Acidobacteriota bacterium]